MDAPRFQRILYEEIAQGPYTVTVSYWIALYRILLCVSRDMQRMYHINVTGELDPITIKMMEVPRCGMADATPKEFLATSRSGNNPDTDLIAQNYYVPGLYSQTPSQVVRRWSERGAMCNQPRSWGSTPGQGRDLTRFLLHLRPQLTQRWWVHWPYAVGERMRRRGRDRSITRSRIPQRLRKGSCLHFTPLGCIEELLLFLYCCPLDFATPLK